MIASEISIRKIGNSFGLILSKDILKAMKVSPSMHHYGVMKINPQWRQRNTSRPGEITRHLRYGKISS